MCIRYTVSFYSKINKENNTDMFVILKLQLIIYFNLI